MRISVNDRWVVRATADLILPAPSVRVWGWMRDWRTFLEMDPLHVSVERLDPPLPHADLLIRHWFLGLSVDRVGRVLRWREHRGFAISDLSRRGVSVGFPHVCSFELAPCAADSSRIIVGVAGRWTATWLPRMMVRMWIGAILTATVVMMRVHWAARGSPKGRGVGINTSSMG